MDWVLDGANVHISMVGFDDGSERVKELDGIRVETINSNLTASTDITKCKVLDANLDIAFRGTQKSGDFNVEDEVAVNWLHSPNPHGKPNSDLLRPWLNGTAIVQRPEPQWIIDTGVALEEPAFSFYDRPYAHALTTVKPERDRNKRDHRRHYWWLHAETCPGMRAALAGLPRFLVTPRVSKFRLFQWVSDYYLGDDGIYVFARSDDYFFGVMHSRIHEVWARSQGTQVRERESGFRYTPKTCFLTFPFPEPTAAQRAAVAAAAKELDALRANWLNPPEWTRTETLTFPGTVGGPWGRYVGDANANGVGTVRYPRLVPADAAAATRLKKRTLTNLYNERPTWLANAHRKLDAAVAAAYGWPPDLADDALLAKLLELNLSRAGAAAPAAGDAG